MPRAGHDDGGDELAPRREGHVQAAPCDAGRGNEVRRRSLHELQGSSQGVAVKGTVKGATTRCDGEHQAEHVSPEHGTWQVAWQVAAHWLDRWARDA